MQYPGYLLNPGDMFQVDPERVMFATGAPKDPKERRAGRARRRARAAEAQAEEAAGEKEGDKSKEESAKEPETKKEEDPHETLKNLLSQAKRILNTNHDTLPAKRKQDLRGFQATVRRMLSRSRSNTSTVLTDSLEAQFLELKNTLNETLKKAKLTESASSDKSTPESAAESQTATTPQNNDNQPSDALTEAFSKIAIGESTDLPSGLSDSDVDVLRQALTTLHDNPIDSSKPYATPWRPRDYMSAFAFIPRYLEVNQNACAAVYLRHPVARPGNAEVPTPFSESLNGSAFAWYLRRR